MGIKPAEAERIYRQRTWIGESFPDSKSNVGPGDLWLFELERVERLIIVLAVGIMYFFLTSNSGTDTLRGRRASGCGMDEGPTEPLPAAAGLVGG